MNWEVILTSGVIAAVVSAVIGGIVGYMVSRRLQLKEHEYQEEKVKVARSDVEQAWRDSIRLNKTQNAVLEFCRANPSERYNLQSGGSADSLLSVDTNERKKFTDMTIRNQINDMISKGYLNELLDEDVWFIFELTEQGKTHEI